MKCVKAHKQSSGCSGLKPKPTWHDKMRRVLEMDTEFLRGDVGFISEGIDTINKLRKEKEKF